MRIGLFKFSILMLALAATPARGGDPDPLAIGVAGHAFDHLGAFADQAPAAAASGMNIIYASGIGSLGYEGLPKAEELKLVTKAAANYVRNAKANGIRLAIGYVCATSIVKLETFDRNWPPELRSQLSSAPAEWLQRDRDGKPLPSWYGGDYRPACMNNPDWRTYEKFIVRQQLEAGHDGIFFDNPTVHPQGCYCDHCMKKFAKFLEREGVKTDVPPTEPLPFLRKLALARPKDFLRFRSSIASDFLTEMRAYARSINPNTLMTCNNSLNSADVLFSQCQTYGYNIHAMSQAEDLVVVEDMASQPRALADGKTIEYAPVYEILHAIAHGKPIVAVTLADGDYHTPPNLMRLAMAEAAAHGASYLAWPTWPENVRAKMITTVRPQTDFLRHNADLLNATTRKTDVGVFLPYRRWVETTECQTLKTANALSRANVQFRVVCEDDLTKSLTQDPPPAMIIESNTVLTDTERAHLDQYKAAGGQVILSEQENWLADFQRTHKTPVAVVKGPPTIRALVREKAGKTIVHLLNLNIQRLSSFEDRVTPAADIHLQVRCPTKSPTSVNALSADPEAARGPLAFKVTTDNKASVIDVTIPRLSISTILVIE